jgi:hypothetical protein
LLFWPFTLFATLAPPASGDATVQLPVEPAPAWSGELSLVQEYRVREAPSGSADTTGVLGVPVAVNPRTDHDLRLTLDGQGRGFHDRLQGQISAALWWDMDGHVPTGQPGQTDLFGEFSDYRQPLFVVYALSAEWRRSLPLEYLRLGRQVSEHGLPITFDGGSLGLRLWERQLSLFGYAGRTVHFFETQPGLFENWVTCAGAGYRPSEHIRLEADSRFEHDTVISRDVPQRVWVYAHSYGLALSTRFQESWGKLFVRGLDRSASHAGGALRLAFPSLAAGIDAQASAQLRTLGEISENENPFYSLLGPSLPNLRARVEVWKEIALGQLTTLGLRAGWRVRQLLSGTEGPFNRNYGGIYFQSELNDLAVKGLFATGILEWNYVPWSVSRDSFLALGGSAGYSIRRIKVEAGTYYQRWKVNYYRDVEELQNARTVYASTGVRALPWLELRARYTLEIVDRYIQSAFFSIREDL